MPTICAAVIAKNESENVERMTKSLEGLFDQYVFVDTGSTDGTQEIAKKLGWDVHHFDWVNDFSKARNYAFSKATTDFIFWCDLDDVLANPEGFKNWKEVVMPLYDYHVANYNYAMKDDKPVCTFARERVVRRDKNMKWMYPIHEGIIPDAGSAISSNFTTAWHINHMRTAADLEKDRSRNLNIFNSLEQLGGMDIRMTYYFGKELFESGKPIDAIPHLQKSLSDQSLQLHDRILATQYLCFSHLAAAEKFKDTETEEKTKHYMDCIKHAQNGVFLFPNRAEFHVLMGDAYIKLGKFEDAIPFYGSAMVCKPMKNGQVASPVFHNEDAYGLYPKNQLARVMANSGDLDRAEKYASEAFDQWGSDETRSMLEEIRRMKFSTVSYKSAKECDDIVFTTPPMHAYPFDPDLMKSKSCGGSETAGIWMAHHLAKLSGRPVKWFMQRPDNKKFDGVDYLSNAGLVEYMSKHKPYIHIAWRHNIKITDAPTFIWSHDLMTPGAEVKDQYNKIMCLTPWHKKHMMATQGVSEDKIWVTRNGLDLGKFGAKSDVKKDPYLFVFGSSPDRGLDNAMLVLDKVRAHFPVKLRIHYGVEHLDKYGLKAMREKLQAMFKERPWVEYVGATQQDALMKSYQEASYNVQPSAWLETSCIASLELVCNGVYPIFRKVGGVSDTLKPFADAGMASLVDVDFSKPEHVDVYAEEVIRAIGEQRQSKVIVDPTNLSWERVAQEWLEQLPKFAYNKN